MSFVQKQVSITMGMFDSYEPKSDWQCPKCGAKLSGWQGKDGPNELLLWKQGEAKPIGFLCVDDEEVIEFNTDQEDDECRLPEIFELHTICDECDSFVDAIGKCNNGVWESMSNVQIVE